MITEQIAPSQIKYLASKLGLELKRPDENGWITTHSPLRDEKNPSFGFNIETGAWKDHGTGETGDMIVLIERLKRMNKAEALSWVEKELDLSNALYGELQNGKRKEKPKAKPFWNDERLQQHKAGMNTVRNNPDHPLLETALEYDCLNSETLDKYGCGIIEQWGKVWLAFPYQTGCQLYRRENEDKVIRSMKGSRPGDSFFGLKQVTGNEILFVAKSPRETMLLSQEYGDRADVIGLCTGEQGTISNEQSSRLRELISETNYEQIYTFLDCDTEAAYETAKQFSSEVDRVAENVNVSLVNIYESTGESYKDITDCMRDGMDREMIDSLLSDSESITNITNISITEEQRGGESIKSITDISIIDEILDTKKAPHIPDEVYSNLPELLKTRCSLIDESHRRDVFLMACLPVIASHLPGVLAGHVDGYYSPDLFTLVVADPGAGKGIAGKAKKLGAELNKYLIEKSQREKTEWQDLPDEAKVKMNEPKEKVLFIPANSSSRAIYDCLEANNGSGLLFETEIDTLLNASGQEWGNFSDITRKAFHHEAVSINRKNERFFIEEPRLSIFISGTFDQFKMMFESAENGHFSRYALYTFDVPRIWKSHRPTRNSLALEDSVHTASKTLFSLYRELNNRETPLYIDLTDEYWESIDRTFSEKMQVIEDLDLSSYLHASNNRAAVLCLRLVSMFTVLRAFEDKTDSITTKKSLTPTEEDMMAALWLADTFIKHAIRLYQILPNATDTDGKGQRYTHFIAMLPDKFKTKEALEIGEGLDIPEPTIKRWLSSVDEVKRIKRGHYEKVS